MSLPRGVPRGVTMCKLFTDFGGCGRRRRRVLRRVWGGSPQENFEIGGALWCILSDLLQKNLVLKFNIS